MNKKYNLKLDLQFRCNNSTMKFNQFDNNTSDFFMRITNGGKLIDIEKAIVVLATIKPSGKVASQFVEVENGLVYADLKANMVDEIGTYTAQAMLILEDERVVTDVINYEVEEDKIFSLLNDTVETTEDFSLLTDMLNRLSTIEISEEQRVINESERILAEENRKIEEAKRVEAELIRQHEEADRAKYDAIRESNENIRKQNESIRLANETNRIDEEAKRVEEENKRKLAEEERNANYNFMTEDEERRRSEANAHKEAENLRVQAETNRVNEEAKRRTTEQARVSAENTRVSNENTREASEVVRKNNEAKRVQAETQRQNRYNSFISDAEANANNFENYTNTAKVKEEERKTNELDRKSQEDRRVSNEVERISNENTRKANEVVREKNEEARQNTFTNKVNEVDKKIIEINTTKDNFISSINTKVDNKISELDNSKTDMSNTVSNKIDEVENRFNALTSKQQQDAEVIDARDGESSLKARLDRDIEKAKQVYVNIEGSHISTDSSSGYLKDVEILGNTIQDASNLADIRSVGDKVEGQELYEIPVLSVGGNLFNINSEYEDNLFYFYSTGNKVNDTSRRSYIVPIKEGMSVKYINSKDIHVTYYTKDGVYISGEVSGDSRVRVVPKGTYFAKFGVRKDVGYEYDKLCVCESSFANDYYEPYQEDKLTILSPTQLEKVGDVADRIICKDGVWGVEKNIESITFSGDEDYSICYPNADYYSIKCTNLFNIVDINENTLCIISSGKYLNKTSWSSSSFVSGNECIFNTVNEKGCFQFTFKREGTFTSLNGCVNYIKNNNLLIKVPLKQPIFIPLPHDQQVKLRTFANKTNISFLTEIEGTIKAQVPKSLGATVNTHTEQISNLTKELDRVKKLEESTVSTVETESDFTTVEATSNGYFEDVKLEGKTLVNKFWFKSISDFNQNKPGVSILDGKLIMSQDASNTSEIYVVTRTNFVDLIRGSGITIMFTSLNTSDSDGLALEIKNSNNITRLKTYYNKNIIYINKSDLNNDDTAVRIRFRVNNQSLSNVTFSNLILLEGDHTQNPPSYFEGLKSVGDGTDEIVVSSVNENLFDVERLIKETNATRYENGFTGVYSLELLSKVESVSKGIVFEEATQYTLQYNFKSMDSGHGSFKIIYTDGTETTSYAIGEGIKTVTSTQGKTISHLSFTYNTGTNIMSLWNITLNKGTTPIPYTPHQSDKKRLLYYNEETQTWEKPILRQWDSIEKHSDGKYYYHQRSGEVVLNGSENWIIDNNNTRFGLYNIESMTGNVSVNVEQISDKFCVYDRYGEKIGSFGVGTGFIRIQNNFGFTTANEFKQWLQANNVTVVYQLAEEKVYECTNIDLITYANETNYIVECGVIVPKTILKVHSNISNVVKILQEKVSLLEDTVTDYMITQNRLMLASRYNADTVSFKVDVATLRNSFEYDNDLYELILNNILVGKDNYNREYIENLIIFYWMDFVISHEMHSTLFEIIEEQHNPKVIEDEEAPL